MNTVEGPLARTVVGVEASEASIEARRQAKRLAMPHGPKSWPTRTGAACFPARSVRRWWPTPIALCW
jgi:hypothetical protein